MYRDMPAGMDSLAEIRLFLNSKIDDQNVPCMENFFYNLILRAELVDKGLWRDVAWITVRARAHKRSLAFRRDLLGVQVFAEAYQAFELSGLDHQDRNDRLQVLRRLLSAAIYDDIHNVHVNHTAGNLLGFPKRLLMVLLERSLLFRCCLACALKAWHYKPRH